MDFSTWAASKGYDLSAMPENQKADLEASWKYQTQKPPEPEKPKVENPTFESKMLAIQAEEARIETIQNLTIAACEKFRGNADKVKLFLAAGATANLADNDGNTALTWAASLGGTVEALNALLEAGAEADAPNKAGVTPLMRAAETGDLPKCMALLNGGAKAGLKDADGRTAADWAAMRSDEPGSKCAAVLSGAGG